MKKIQIIFCLVVTMSIVTTVHAADVLYRMLHADEVESFKADQDAMIVGQLIEKKDNQYAVNVLKVISGEVTSNTITVDSNIKYGWVTQEEMTPAIDDYCVMSIKRIGNYYRQAWGTFKVNSGDYKTLKIIKYSNINSDVACIEWYVNSGGTEKDFSFSDGKAYVKRANGEIIQIYPKQGTNTAVQTTTANSLKKSVETKQDINAAFTISAVLILLFITTVLGYRKKIFKIK